MMKEYRIVEHKCCGDKRFVVQKKSIFRFWYNPDNKDGITTGQYDTLEEAKGILRRKLAPITKKVVYKISVRGKKWRLRWPLEYN